MKRLAHLELVAAIAWRNSIACLYSIRICQNSAQAANNDMVAVFNYVCDFWHLSYKLPGMPEDMFTGDFTLSDLRITITLAQLYVRALRPTLCHGNSA
jgi:hypothetical protein